MATGLENLEIYQLACKLEKIVDKIADRLPNEEKFRKTDQLKRSSSSVADNIAESYGRFGYQDKIQFLYKARGSAEEARSQLRRTQNFIENELLNKVIRSYTIEIKKINGYIRYLRNQKSKQINKSTM